MLEKVKLGEKIAYGLGDAASCMFWKLFTMYLLFFYTDIIGLPAAAIGTMLLVTCLWNTFLDPFIGVICDRTNSRWGKFRPYILWMTIPFGICAVLTFTSPAFGITGKLIYAYISYTLMMTVYSFINVPYASLLGVMSSNPQTRTVLSIFRMTFAFGGSFLVLLLIEPLVAYFNIIGSTETKINLIFGWQMAAVVFAVIAVVMFFATFLCTRERVEPVNDVRNNFRDDLKDLGHNKPWWILFFAGILALIFNSMRDGSAVYYFKYYVRNTEAFRFSFMDASVSLTTLYFILGQAANIIGILFVIPLSRSIGKKMTYLTAMASASVFSVLFYFLDRSNIMGIMLLQFTISFCAGIIFPLLWSMYADIADYSEIKTGRRATGLIFSSSSMSQKFGWTIGGALTGWLFSYFGFHANAIQTEMAQNGIRMMMSFLPAAGTILSVVVIAFYPLND
ncbi:MAG: MFS transporter [Bacteroidota bacterium]|nr:MFS transporter [Bacteroidota bacterium]